MHIPIQTGILCFIRAANANDGRVVKVISGTMNPDWWMVQPVGKIQGKSSSSGRISFSDGLMSIGTDGLIPITGPGLVDPDDLAEKLLVSQLRLAIANASRRAR